MNTDNQLIKQKRLPIMGIAALWIMLFHSTIKVPVPVIDFINKTGYLGVDIFMFMSGFSMYHSFTKTCNSNSKLFIKKRMARILPTFVPFAILWWGGYIYKNYNTKDLLLQAMHSKTFWITMTIFRWFIPCICFCYLITPLINWIIQQTKYTYVAMLILIIPIISASFIFLGSSVALMFMLRIPEYIIGYCYGIDKERYSNIIYRVVILFCGIIIYASFLYRFSDEMLSDYGLYWYPAILLTSSMVICLARILPKSGCKLLSFIGKRSLEVYLWHFYILFPFSDILKNLNIKFDKYNLVINFFVIVITLIVSCGYSKIIDSIVNLYKKRKLHVEGIN